MHRQLLLCLPFAFLLAAPVATQCPASVTITPYGKPCAFFGQSPVLVAKYDPTRCRLALQFETSPTCCNTYPSAQVLLLGSQPLVPGVPHPALLPGCELAVQPTVALVGAGRGDPFVLRIPAISGVTVYAQGMNEYFTTIGFTRDYQTTDGLRIAF